MSIQTEYNWLNGSELCFLNRSQYQSNGEWRARSDCTHVQSDLALHSPQNKYMVAKDKIRFKRFTSDLTMHV